MQYALCILAIYTCVLLWRPLGIRYTYDDYELTTVLGIVTIANSLYKPTLSDSPSILQ